jgi:hypothetical protein
LPNRADLVARIETVEGEAERAKQAGDNTSALHAYRRLLLLDPGHVDAHHHLAVAADMDGEFSEAEQHYRAALAREPENPDLHTSLGWSLFLQHRDGEALGELRRALELDPEHATALYNMGWLAAHRGEEAEALRYFRRGGTEAQAQALLSKVRLELEDRSSRDGTQRAVARLAAPSPRGRPQRNEEASEGTVQAGAEWEATPSVPPTRTVSLETEQPPVRELPDGSAQLDDESEPRLLPSIAAEAEPATRHLAERPLLPTVARPTESEERLPEGVIPEAVADEPGGELPMLIRTGAEGEEGRSETRPLTGHPRAPTAAPNTRRESRSASLVRPAAALATASGPAGMEGAEDLTARQGDGVVSPADSWPAFSTRTLATVGRVMLGKPPAGREPSSRQVREVRNADAEVVRETAADVGEHTSNHTHSEIDSEMIHAARLGLNFGQPATRRFHASPPAGDESE